MSMRQIVNKLPRVKNTVLFLFMIIYCVFEILKKLIVSKSEIKLNLAPIQTNTRSHTKKNQTLVALLFYQLGYTTVAMSK